MDEVNLCVLQTMISKFPAPNQKKKKLAALSIETCSVVFESQMISLNYSASTYTTLDLSLASRVVLARAACVQHDPPMLF